MSPERSTSLMKQGVIWEVMWIGGLVVMLFVVSRGCLSWSKQAPFGGVETDAEEPDWDVVLARKLDSVRSSIVVKDGPFDRRGDASLTRVERIVTPKQRHEWYDKITWKIEFASGDVAELNEYHGHKRNPMFYSQRFIKKLFIKEEFDVLREKMKRQGNVLKEWDYNRLNTLFQDGPLLPDAP